MENGDSFSQTNPTNNIARLSLNQLASMFSRGKCQLCLKAHICLISLVMRTKSDENMNEFWNFESRGNLKFCRVAEDIISASFLLALSDEGL